MAILVVAATVPLALSVWRYGGAIPASSPSAGSLDELHRASLWVLAALGSTFCVAVIAAALYIRMTSQAGRLGGRRTSLALGFGCALGAVLVAASTRSYELEARTPFPDGCSLHEPLGEFGLPASFDEPPIESPTIADEIDDGPIVEVTPNALMLDGARVDALEEALRSGSAPARGAPTVIVGMRLTEPGSRVASTLAAIRNAGYRRVALVFDHRRMVNRPVLGELSARCRTTLVVWLVPRPGATELDAASYETYGGMATSVLALRGDGREVSLR